MFLGLVLTVLNLNHLYDVCNTLRPSQEGTSKGDHKVWELLKVMYRLNRAQTESLCIRHIYRGSNADMRTQPYPGFKVAPVVWGLGFRGRIGGM